jgi:hypothetical protein
VMIIAQVWTLWQFIIVVRLFELSSDSRMCHESSLCSKVSESFQIQFTLWNQVNVLGKGGCASFGLVKIAHFGSALE